MQNKSLEEIRDAGKIIAIIVRADYSVDGISFLTPDDFSQQLGYMRHPAGKQVKPHVHHVVLREIEYTQEVLFIRSGRVRVDFYSEAKEFIESRILAKGDVIMLASGGHGLEMLEQTEIIEVKQGPYAGADDKEHF